MDEPLREDVQDVDGGKHGRALRADEGNSVRHVLESQVRRLELAPVPLCLPAVDAVNVKPRLDSDLVFEPAIAGAEVDQRSGCIQAEDCIADLVGAKRNL